MITQQQLAQLEVAAHEKFGCGNLAMAKATRNHREQRHLSRQRQDIADKTSAFGKVMNSPNPPQTRDEAIESTMGVLGMILSYLFPQYRLAISIIGFLWDMWQRNSASVTIAGVAEGGGEGRG